MFNAQVISEGKKTLVRQGSTHLLTKVLEQAKGKI